MANKTKKKKKHVNDCSKIVSKGWVTAGHSWVNYQYFSCTVVVLCFHTLLFSYNLTNLL